MKKSIVVFVICFVSGVSLLIIPFFIPYKISNKILQKEEFRGTKTKIIVTVYSEWLTPVPGAYYIFEAEDQSKNRREIMTFRHDDVVPVSKNKIHFINDDIVVIFFGWKYFVTRDGGKTWSGWNAESFFPNWECCPYDFIKDVSLSENGKGNMEIETKFNPNLNVLYTCDFGFSWQINYQPCRE